MFNHHDRPTSKHLLSHISYLSNQIRVICLSFTLELTAYFLLSISHRWVSYYFSNTHSSTFSGIKLSGHHSHITSYCPVLIFFHSDIILPHSLQTDTFCLIHTQSFIFFLLFSADHRSGFVLIFKDSSGLFHQRLHYSQAN